MLETITELAPEQISAAPETRLWMAVLARTLEEWMRGTLRARREAENYLLRDEEDFRAVCHSAGLDPDRFRARLHELLRKNPSLAANCRN